MPVQSRKATTALVWLQGTQPHVRTASPSFYARRSFLANPSFFFMQRCFLSCSPPRQAPFLRKRLKPMLPRQLPPRPARLGRTAPLPPQRGLARPHARATSSQSAWLAGRGSSGECASWNATTSVCCERSRTSGEATIGYRSPRRRQAPHQTTTRTTPSRSPSPVRTPSATRFMPSLRGRPRPLLP